MQILTQRFLDRMDKLLETDFMRMKTVILNTYFTLLFLQKKPDSRNNKWYVTGFCHLRNDIRIFRADRIESLMLTENNFYRPEHFSARDFFMKNLLPTIEGY